jgi:hypothetical protein
MKKESPYEYHNNVLGVQGRFLFAGDKRYEAHEDSLCLISYSGLAKRIEREATAKLRDGGGAESPMLVSFDSLPLKWQEAIVAIWGKAPKLTQQTLFEKHYVRDMAAFDFYTRFKFDDHTSLDRAKIDEYTINASVLNTIGTVYEMRYKIRKELRGRVNDIWSTIINESNLFKQETGHTLPENERRLREKYNDYKKNGYKCLIHKGYRKANALKVDDRHIELLNYMFAGIDHKPTYAEVAQTYDGFVSGYVEVINEETGEIYDPKEFSRLSVATVWNHLSKWENKIGTFLARSGDRQVWMQLFKPYHNLNVQEKAGAIISIDDRQPPFKYDSDGNRVWFYCGVDVGSEAFTSWVWGKDKKGIITEFYRQMVRNYAYWGLCLPYELECESNLNASFKDTFLKPGNMFEHVRIEANNARGKVIERYWRQLRYGEEKKDAGWLARPFALGEANQSRTEKGKDIIVPYDEIVERSLRHIQDWNNSEHSKIKGMSRWDVFLSTQHPGLNPINYHGILPYLGMKESSSVNAGIMNFRRSKFLLGLDGVICTGDKLINMMMQVEGRDVDIYWLDDNFGEVLKAHIYIGDRFICEAIEQPGYRRAKIDRTDQDMINRELMSKYENTITSYANRKKKGLEKVTIIDNRPVTINNNFQIPGLNNYVPRAEPAKVLANVENEQLTVSSQQLVVNGERSFKKSLLNSF